jgi:AcrR family transcriptional regulator
MVDRLGDRAHSRIVGAAAEVFARRGFEGARIDEIAERAGVNKAMLYYHVGDKERLYTAVLVESSDRALWLLRAATSTSGTPGGKLQAILDTFASFGTTNPPFIPIMLREVASGGRNLPDEMLARVGGLLRVLADVLAEGEVQGAFRPTDALLTHVSLIGALLYVVATHPLRQRAALWSNVPVPDHTPEHLARHIGNLFLHGIEAAPVPAAAPARPVSRKRRRRSR